MNPIQKLKLNDEVIDGLCSFFKASQVLIQKDTDNLLLYSYLLLQATGIERLQKILYILDYSAKNTVEPTDEDLRRKLGHGILEIHLQNFEIYFEPSEKIYIDTALKILTELVNVKNGYRYTNFNLHNDQTFNLQVHITQILSLNGLDYSAVDDYIKASWQIVDAILKKYISILVNLIWHKKVGNGEVTPICLQDYVTKGWQEINLEFEIKTILNNSMELK